MYIELGKIVGVWGVKGGIKCHSYTRNRYGICDYSQWILLPPIRQKSANLAVSARIDAAVSRGITLQNYDVLQCKQQGRGIVARLAGVNNRDAAFTLMDYSILLQVEDLPTLSAGEYYWQQIIDLDVWNAQQHIGRVRSMMETGANDVMIIDTKDGKEILVPYVMNIVIKDIDLEKNIMQIEWDPTCLE